MEFTQVTRFLWGIATISLMTFCIQKMCKQLWFRYRLKNVEGPSGLPFLGNALQFGTNNIESFKALDRWCNEFRGNGFYKLFLGLKPTVVIFNPYDIEKILRDTSVDNKGFGETLLKAWVGKSLFLSKGSKWVARRKLLTPSFHFSILTKFLPVFNEHAQTLSKKLLVRGLSSSSSVVIAPLVTSCTLDITFETIMGKDRGSQKGHNQEYMHAIERLSDITMRRVWNPLYWNETLFRFLSPGREYVKCLDTVYQTSKKVIRERKLENQQKVDVIIDDSSLEVRKRRRLAFLDLLIEVQKQHGDLTDEVIQGEVNSFMLGGHETTATSLTFALYLIGRHPDVQRKIHEELEVVFENDIEREVTTEDLPKLEYLTCVMKESQRMLTTVPTISRELESDLEICGSTVPKGTLIMIGLYWLHRDPKQFPNPDTFDPDRFSSANSQGRHNFAFIPFSAGHRNCIGQKFAIMEEKVILATLLRKFELKSEQDLSTLKVYNGFTLTTVEDIKMIFTPRK